MSGLEDGGAFGRRPMTEIGLRRAAKWHVAAVAAAKRAVGRSTGFYMAGQMKRHRFGVVSKTTIQPCACRNNSTAFSRGKILETEMRKVHHI